MMLEVAVVNVARVLNELVFRHAEIGVRIREVSFIGILLFSFVFSFGPAYSDLEDSAILHICNFLPFPKIVLNVNTAELGTNVFVIREYCTTLILRLIFLIS